MRTGRRAALAMAAAMTAACGAGNLFGLFRPYEYEEDIYLSLDRTATVYVNSSVPALDALRGATFDVSPNARLDRAAVRKFYAAPFAHVVSVTGSRRSNRRFVHVRIEVDDIQRLGEAEPFAWSTYRLGRQGDSYEYRQSVGDAARSAVKAVGQFGWTGRELVAFRLHLPSKIFDPGTGNIKRGNILVWEQSLADRLRGAPLSLEARMATQSILYRTLWLFGMTLVAVVATFGLVVGVMVKKGAGG